MADMCMSGDFCPEEAIPSPVFPRRRLFCQKHQERLNAIREHMEDRAWSNNIRNKEGVLVSFCETSGCDNRPVYGGEFCAQCQGDD